MALLKNKIIFYNLFLLIIYLSKLLPASSLQCKGEQNEDVDWFVLYKIPKLPNNNNVLIKEGFAYLYMDNNSFKNGWTLSKNNISSKSSIPGYTLAPLYDDENSKSLLWFLYNDQAPNKNAKVHKGHTKGVIVTNENEGFWLIHSVPHFPFKPNTGYDFNISKRKRSVNSTEKIKTDNLPVGQYGYPSSGTVNGQSFLCVSTNQMNLNVIAKQLMYNEIIVYKKNIPNYSLDKYKNLVDAANNVNINDGSHNNKVNIYSKGGQEFVSFAKSSKWGKDLYEDFVAPELYTDLYTETWLNGPGRLPSDCQKSRVMNIESIALPMAKVNFKNTHDHSKWAISIEGEKNSWVCVGDINRANTQWHRGGGTLCLNLPDVWVNYKSSISNVEPCPKGKFKKYYDKVKSWFTYYTQ